MASGLALFPLGNRGLSKSFDCNGTGLFAYGVRSCIYIFDLRISPPRLLDSMVLRNSHNGKVLSVSFCKSDKLLLASLGDEGILKIWDLETSTCVVKLEVKEIATVIEWLHGSNDLVVFPEVYGCISKWNFKANTATRIKTGSESKACVLASNRNSPELLAVGHVIGSISVLDINSMVLLHKLKTHSMQIENLCWSPISPSLLLSVSLDQSVRIWKLKEFKPVKTYYYPTAKYKTDNKKKNFCYSLWHPEDPDVVICSNVRGLVGSVTFKDDEVPKFQPYNTKDADSNYKTVYTMLTFYSENDRKHLLVTVDFTKISLWDISNQKLLMSYNFVYGNINFLGISAFNPNVIAICSGDGIARVWDSCSETNVEVSSIYINFRVKVMTVAWHPILENIFAFGTDEGRVGIIDFYRKRVLYSYESHHSSTVYCLQWGPCSKLGDSKDLYLYSCGGGIIYIHELNKSKEKAADFDALVAFPPDQESLKGYTELSWKSDFTCLAVGNCKGFVVLLDKDLNFFTQLNLQMKNIESLRWHPLITFASGNGSTCSSWLAAAGNDVNIHIFDTADVTKEHSDSILCKSIRTLTGHKKRVSSISWSPHDDGHLASASRDGTVQIWNVITSTCEAIYPWHRDLVYTVQWSAHDPDVIYSGGMDNCLRVWKISEQNKALPSEKCLVAKHRAYKMKVKKPEVEESLHENETDTNDNGTAEKCKVTGVEDLIKQTSSKGKIKTNAAGDFSNIARYHLKSLFPDIQNKFHTKEECLDDILKLTDILSNEPESESQNTSEVCDKMSPDELMQFGFYADQQASLRMLQARGHLELNKGNIEKASFFQLITSNIEPLLASSAEKKQLSDFLVAFAPAVSYEFWHEMCEKYAIQLVEEQQYVKASMYFLLCGKLYEAIKILLEKGKFIEALALAKARLPETDPVLKSVYSKAAHQYSVEHLVISEASCYLALKEPIQAAKILYCTAKSKYMYASAYICSKFNLIEEAKSYGYFCLEKCLSQNDWQTFYKVAEVVTSMKVYNVLVRVHELISIHLKLLKKNDDSKFFGLIGNKLLIWEGKTFGDSNVSFLTFIYETIKSEGILPNDEESLNDIHTALIEMDIKRKKYDTSAEAHIGVAIYITQIIITALLREFHCVTENFMKIFSISYNVVFLPRVLCCLLLPLNLYWCSNENAFVCESKIMDTEISPFRDHFKYIYAEVCNEFTSISKSDFKDSTIFQCISSDLNESIQQVLPVLSEKTVIDSILLYFCAFFLRELRRQAKDGWRFRCYNISTNSNISSDNIIIDNESTKSDANIIDQSTSFVENAPKQTEDETSVGCTADIVCQNGTDQIADVICENVHEISDERASDIANRNGIVEEIVNETALGITDNKIEEYETITLENIDNDDHNDDYCHAQCWCDISLYYVVTKHLTSVLCKDEYALKFYLQKHLQKLDNAIAHLARQKSSKLSEVNCSQMDNSSKSSSSYQKTVSNFFMNSDLSAKENNTNTDFMSSSIMQRNGVGTNTNNGSSIQENRVTTSERNGENGSDVLHNVDVVLDSVLQSKDKLSSSNDNVICSLEKKFNTNIGSSMQENRVAINNKDDNEQQNKASLNKDDEIKLENNFIGDIVENEATKDGIELNEPNFNIVNSTSLQESDVCVNTEQNYAKAQDQVKVEFNETELLCQKDFLERMQAEHKVISEQIKLFNLEKFSYPDPFDAVLTINEICFDIVRKNPCKLIKEKFHELAHEVNQWNVKFCTKGETLICGICQEKVSA